MRRLFWILSVFFLLSFGASAQDFKASLKELKTEQGAKLYHPPGATLRQGQVELDGEAFYQLVATTLSPSDPTVYEILFSQGPSDDPQYAIAKKNAQGALTVLSTIGAETFYVTGNGVLYSEGQSNQMFNKRRKYQFANGAVSEVLQPFYDVSFETVLTRDFDLTKTPGGSDVVARLPKGSKVTLVLNQGDADHVNEDFLLKTPFGLLGWVRVSGGSISDTADGTGIQGVRYWGD